MTDKPIRAESGQPSSQGNTDSLDGKIYDAMCTLGWLTRLDDKILKEDEILFEQSRHELPIELSDPSSIIQKIRERESAAKEKTASINQAVAENLARAAREGGKIAPEIEERMKRDREATERQTNQGYEDLYD